MLDHAKHRSVLLEILKDIYSDTTIRTALGFKGGTAAMLAYGLSRISVDLDFDLLDENKKTVLFETIKTILNQHGKLREAREKRHTLFFLMSYEKGQHTIKIDISKRAGRSEFHLKTFLGIPMLVMNQEDMTAGKLSALLTRKKFAMRDVFDLWFFLKNKWAINNTVVTEKTGLTIKKALTQAIKKIGAIKKNQALNGLGELLDPKQKSWAKDHLIKDTIFHLRLYGELMKKRTIRKYDDQARSNN
ncbi:nucleotidyl transferase AbiEii/AbiGii toxin family protein [Candidatus Gottesmanbacteria bacterium]|nr:nucleotidyl transferase AbiEii/AbiGii toxin family protein [Candidatus Gottesmanbacteria bacterium]